MDEKDAFTIADFCRRHGFSQSFYFKLQAAGDGPRVMRIGARTLISKESAEKWRHDREAASENMEAHAE